MATVKFTLENVPDGYMERVFRKITMFITVEAGVIVPETKDMTIDMHKIPFEVSGELISTAIAAYVSTEIRIAKGEGNIWENDES